MKFKRLIPAFCMLLVAAIVLSTSTFAWFSMSGTVTANNMEIKAKSEGGIVITNESGTDWLTVKPASHNGKIDVSGTPTSIAVVPTSTLNGSTWYHNTSSQFDNADATQATATYEVISSDANFVAVDSNGVGFIDTAGSVAANNDQFDIDSETAYYLKNDFYIKNTDATATTDATNSVLWIRSVKVEDTDSTLSSGDLNKALRVAIRVTSQQETSKAPYFAIFYGFDGATATYTVGGSTSGTEITAVKATATNDDGATPTPTVTPYIVDVAIPNENLGTIPGNTATINGAGDPATPKAVKVEVYLYFEGEDANCKSSNLKETLDSLKVELVFATSHS